MLNKDLPSPTSVIETDSQDEKIIGCDNLIQSFRTINDDSKRKPVIKEIVNFSNLSESNREICISLLLKEVNNYYPNHLSNDYLLWEGSVLTLGELRSIEAVNILASCLDLNDGSAGYVIERYPAANALYKIGKPAFPKLFEILRLKPDKRRLNRFWALFIISRLGGKDEKPILREILKTEKDANIAHEIKDFLKH